MKVNRNPDIQDCAFYHSLTFPDGSQVSGDWDLRSVMKGYLANYDFSGKRVLDIGTGTGAISFYAEQCGASEVVSFDQSDHYTQDLLPEWKTDLGYVEKQRNGYWYAHKKMRSKARCVYGDIYNLCLEGLLENGLFDVAVLGSILLHLESPFSALRSASGVAKAIIVTDRAAECLQFRPAYEHKPNDFAVWWSLPEIFVVRMLESLGHVVQPGVLTDVTSSRFGTLNLYSLLGIKP